MPARDEEATVGACVAACWAQTLAPCAVVVVDNGSSDNTARHAEEAGATVLSEPVANSYRARNRGWRATTSSIVAFTDADCVPDPTWLAELVAGFSDPSVTGVGGRIVQDKLNSATQRWIVERKFLDQEFNAAGEFLPFLATANAAYRRSALEAADGFDTVFTSGGDNDLSWRLQALHGGRLVYRPEAAVRHRVGEGLTEITGDGAGTRATSSSSSGAGLTGPGTPRCPASSPGRGACGSCPWPSPTGPSGVGPCRCPSSTPPPP